MKFSSRNALVWLLATALLRTVHCEIGIQRNGHGSFLIPSNDPNHQRVMIRYNDVTFLQKVVEFAADGQIRGFVRNHHLFERNDGESKDPNLQARSKTNWILSIIVNGTETINQISEHPMVDRVEIDQILSVQVTGSPRILDMRDANGDDRDFIRQISTVRGSDCHEGSRDLEEIEVNGERVPYGITMVQAPLLWPMQAVNPDVKVCVVDTGYNIGHEDLPTFVTGHVKGTNTAAGVWYNDGNGHGTHCAGTIGALGNNSVGVVGVRENPNTTIFHVGRALEENGDGFTSNIIMAVQGCVDDGAKVISLSLGGGSNSTIEEDFYSEIYNSGILLVAAAGNSGNSGHLYPGSYSSVIAVSAVNENGMRPDFSQCHSQVELVAPGVNVLSTHPPNTYASESGTSMAAPHVAGIAAQLMTMFPECKNYQIRNAMVRSAKGVGEYPGYCNEGYGNGLIQGKAAYDLLLAEGCEGAGGPIVEIPSRDGARGGCEQNIDFLAFGNRTYRNECPGPQLKSGGYSFSICLSHYAVILGSLVALF